MGMADIGWNAKGVKRKITPSLEVVAHCSVHRKFVVCIIVGLGIFDDFGISGQLRDRGADFTFAELDAENKLNCEAQVIPRKFVSCFTLGSARNG